MPRIRKNKEYPLVFLTDYDRVVKEGDRCKFISSYKSGLATLVDVELENGTKKRCYHWRIGGIEKYLEGTCQG